MAKLSRAAVKEKITEYAVASKKLANAENALNADLAPFLEKYNEDTKPVIDKHEKKIASQRSKVEALGAEIYEFLDAQESDIEIEMNGYVAERKTQTKLMARVIDVKKFLEVAKKKGEAMFACISVGVKKAEDLLGKEIDLISERPKKVEVVCLLRLK